MNQFGVTVSRELDRARRVSAIVRQGGGRATVLGALVLAVSTATAFAGANTPPHLTSLALSSSVLRQGETLTVTGAFSDPDTTDAHTLYVWWQDRHRYPGKPEKVQLPAGQTSFQLTHTYPGLLPPTFITVTVIDHQLPHGANDNTEGGGSDQRRLPIEVRNTPPRLVASSLEATTIEGQPGVIVVEGDWVDPDVGPGRVTLKAGDGQPRPTGVSVCATTDRHFRCEHEYDLGDPPRSKVYAIEVRVSDGDGGSDVWKPSVRVP